MTGIEVPKLFAHLSEEPILKRLELAQTEHLRLLWVFLVPLDEVKNITLLLLGNFTLGHILEDPAQVVAQLFIVVILTQGCNRYFVEVPLVEKFPRFVTRPTVC